MSRKSIYDEKKILSFFIDRVLEIGYDNTSMRMVASEFNMPVSSLYRYFKSKEELLDEALRPVVDAFNRMYDDYKNKTYEILKSESIDTIFEKQKNPQEFIDLMYKYFSEFKILLSHLNGTKYENFAEKLVNLETNSTMEFISALRANGFKIKNIDYKYIKILNETNYEAYFSIIKNNLSYNEALEFSKIISDYFTEGYKKIFIEDN